MPVALVIFSVIKVKSSGLDVHAFHIKSRWVWYFNQMAQIYDFHNVCAEFSSADLENLF